ncbi:hypothetical protein ACLOJK_024589 [Asimina triloba]
MTGLGSPCGACKFLRRKCVKGCVFASYFCYDQGAAHFAAIHKVFGASNVSKLLTHLPVSDRQEAAATISYEAQARLQDPIYGCVSHIFALQQQVVSLQAQLASLKAQSLQNVEEQKSRASFSCYKQDGHGSCDSQGLRGAIQSISNPPGSVEAMSYYGMNSNSMGGHCHLAMPVDQAAFTTNGDSSHLMSYADMQMDQRKWDFQDMDDLQSAASAFLHHG